MLYLLRIYIWNLSHGGGIKRPKEEYRIQITGVDQFTQKEGEKTLILGWWQDVEVFAGFDYNKHKSKLGFSPSMQIREENLRNAAINGFSPCDKDNGEIALAFRPDFLIDYVKNLDVLHAIGDTPDDVELFESIANGDVAVNNQKIIKLPKARLKVMQTLEKKLRDNSFKRRVLSAYGNKCAFSGVQLRLVDAAHIIPVKVDGSTDDTSNGIALSALYHRAYDQRLVTFNERYQIEVNKKEYARLKGVGLDGGIDLFIKGLRPMIIVPPAINDRPNIEFVKTANKLRGWE